MDGGTEVTIGKSDTTVTDEDLSFDTTYCYKIFWYDDLENVTTATASGTTGDPQIAISGSRSSISFSIFSDDSESSSPSILATLSMPPTLYEED